MDITVLATLILVLLVSCMFIYSTWDKMYRHRNLPPGPMPLPIIGSILHIRHGELVKSLNQLREKYGSVYTLYFGSRPVVILTGYQMVKDALIDQADEFSNRGQIPMLDNFFHTHGMIFSNGERWKQLRRFTLMTLRNFGMGKRSIEERIQEEAHFLTEELKSHKGKRSPFNPTDILVQTISNVICSIVFGNRFDYKDLRFLKLLNLFNEVFQLTSSTWGQVHTLIPEIINPFPGPHQRIRKILDEILVFVSERVKMNRETFDPSNPRDFIDCYLIKMIQEKKNPNSEYTEKNMLMSLMQVFVAGTETISSTLRHGLLILLKHPEIQVKLHEEIDRVIGDNRCPSIEDRSKMPYTDAVIHEIQRFSDVLPLNLPHSAVTDIKFHGYNIPKGTDVYPLLYCALRDPEYFETPNKFNPNHFLDQNGSFKKEEAFIPFSTGKRVCAGEGLAKMELFLFFTTILQKFKLTTKMHLTESDISPKMTGFSNVPIPYELSFVSR
ncbi:cytochrome P450 2G1-like [Ranitomeya imitator]|uniref:cytochrome P450 2G1-like n=1 Tax=Ranitomeya imitator TaxID=111125 RepID=UPI0037E773CE